MKEIVYRFICAYGLLQTQGQLSVPTRAFASRNVHEKDHLFEIKFTAADYGIIYN